MEGVEGKARVIVNFQVGLETPFSLDPRMGSWDQTDTISDIFFLFLVISLFYRGGPMASLIDSS